MQSASTASSSSVSIGRARAIASACAIARNAVRPLPDRRQGHHEAQERPNSVSPDDDGGRERDQVEQRSEQRNLADHEDQREHRVHQDLIASNTSHSRITLGMQSKP
jgi:hypothetical protein